MLKTLPWLFIVLVIPVLPCTVFAQNCPTTLAYLDSRLPRYNHRGLDEVRQAVLRENVLEVIRRGRAQGMSPSQVAATALGEARNMESQQPAHEQCIRQLAASNPEGIILRLKNGTFDFGGGTTNALSACAAEYINFYYAMVALKEIAIGVACHANR